MLGGTGGMFQWVARVKWGTVAIWSVILAYGGSFVVYVMVAGDRMAGVSREVSVARLPTVECVTRVLRATPCVTSVNHSRVEARASWGLSGDVNVDPAYDVIAYNCGDASGDILLTQRNGARPATLRLDATTIAPGHPEVDYPPDRIQRIRSTFGCIYLGLAAQCGPLPAASAVVDTIDD